MNNVCLAGTVGAFEIKKIAGKKDGEMYTVCNISLAIAKKNSTMWVNLVSFNEGLIEKVIIPYLSKGSKIAISGELNIREYTKDNMKKQSTEVVINELTLMGSSKKQLEGELAMAKA